MSDVFERFLAFGLAGASIIISLLDFAGLLQGIPFLAGHTSALSLLVLGAAIGYLALERRNKLDKIEEAVTQGFEKTLSSFAGGPVIPLRDSKALFEYLAQRLKEAHTSVDDLTWGAHLTKRRTDAVDTSFKQYVLAEASITVSSSVDYREVMTFPDIARLERAESLAGKEHFGYQLRYYDIDHQSLPALLQFTIIDSEEVIFTFHRGLYVSPEPEVFLATRQKEMVHLFQDYFNAIWDRAREIKAAGQPADPQVLQHIRQRYHSGQVIGVKGNKRKRALL